MNVKARRVGRVARFAPLAVLLSLALIVISTAKVSPSHLEPRVAFASPSAAHLFGCGEGGIDLLVYVAFGIARGTVLAVVVALIGFVIGTPLGAFAAVRRGGFERAVERTCDLLQGFPSFLLALSVLSVVRVPTRAHLALVFSLTAWAPFARLALAQVRVLREAQFVEAARALGQGSFAIFWMHILPQLLGVVAVQLGSTASAVVVSEAGLAFVGFGTADGVSLGAVLDQGVSVMLRAPHVLWVGSLSVFLTSVALISAGRAAQSE